MRSRFVLGILTVALALGAPSAHGQEVTLRPEGAHATLPLAELLELRRELDDEKRKPDAAPPPIVSAVDAIELSGRLVDESLEVEAKMGVTVLAEGWTSVPLLRLAPGIAVTSAPMLEGATLAVRDGWLALVTKEARTWRFRVGLAQRAPDGPGPHRLELETAPATLAALRVSYDERLYRVLGPVTREADGVRVDPDGTHFRVAWQAREGAAPAPEPVEAPRPELEPVIVAAHASLVSTLEGRWLTRVLYDLRFTGRRTLEVRIPPGARLAKVFRDRAPLPFALDGDVLRLELTPERSGGESAVLELVLEQDHGAYHLAGRLDVALPEASWPAHEVNLALHLPAVFEYAWVDGSLAPLQQRADAPDWSYDLPEPGKALFYRQLLVTRSAPRLTLHYDVDLDGAYFVPPGAAAAEL
jgi:hypothetical protein